jgi:hypothetical protein
VTPVALQSSTLGLWAEYYLGKCEHQNSGQIGQNRVPGPHFGRMIQCRSDDSPRIVMECGKLPVSKTVVTTAEAGG